ncbi:hypothetical protein [Streptomyces sp. NPDC059874]|uniref:hypothetical protein n=1 Tax=Streptomyces sp. NPDC059874 TaxID=3346983 RepID=UPI003659F17F
MDQHRVQDVTAPPRRREPHPLEGVAKAGRGAARWTDLPAVLAAALAYDPYGRHPATTDFAHALHHTMTPAAHLPAGTHRVLGPPAADRRAAG